MNMTITEAAMRSLAADMRRVAEAAERKSVFPWLLYSGNGTFMGAFRSLQEIEGLRPTLEPIVGRFTIMERV